MYNIVPKGSVLKMCLGNEHNILKESTHIFEKKTKLRKFILNTEQKKSLEDLNKFGKKFNTSVLQGTTGSGKTLVYFERVKNI